MSRCISRFSLIVAFQHSPNSFTTVSGEERTCRLPSHVLIVSVTNARVVLAAILSSATVKIPDAIASLTHLSASRSNLRRHPVEQNLCGLPPEVRGRNFVSHLKHFIVSMFVNRAFLVNPEPLSSFLLMPL